MKQEIDVARNIEKVTIERQSAIMLNISNICN